MEKVNGFTYYKNTADLILDLLEAQGPGLKRQGQINTVAAAELLQSNEWAIGKYLDYLMWTDQLDGEPDEEAPEWFLKRLHKRRAKEAVKEVQRG